MLLFLRPRFFSTPLNGFCVLCSSIPQFYVCSFHWSSPRCFDSRPQYCRHFHRSMCNFIENITHIVTKSNHIFHVDISHIYNGSVRCVDRGQSLPLTSIVHDCIHSFWFGITKESTMAVKLSTRLGVKNSNLSAKCFFVNER